MPNTGGINGVQRVAKQPGEQGWGPLQAPALRVGGCPAHRPEGELCQRDRSAAGQPARAGTAKPCAVPRTMPAPKLPIHLPRVSGQVRRPCLLGAPGMFTHHRDSFPQNLSRLKMVLLSCSYNTCFPIIPIPFRFQNLFIIPVLGEARVICLKPQIAGVLCCISAISPAPSLPPFCFSSIFSCMCQAAGSSSTSPSPWAGCRSSSQALPFLFAFPSAPYSFRSSSHAP